MKVRNYYEALLYLKHAYIISIIIQLKCIAETKSFKMSQIHVIKNVSTQSAVKCYNESHN